MFLYHPGSLALYPSTNPHGFSNDLRALGDSMSQEFTSAAPLGHVDGAVAINRFPPAIARSSLNGMRLKA